MPTISDSRDIAALSYSDHLRALERLATKLEDVELDPEMALAAYREAIEHHRLAEAILDRVECEMRTADVRD